MNPRPQARTPRRRATLDPNRPGRRQSRDPSGPGRRTRGEGSRHPRLDSDPRHERFATGNTSPRTGLEALEEEGTARSGCIVYVVDGEHDDRGQYLDFQGGSLLIGKSRSCDLRLSDPRVSRCHVELSVTAQGIRVRDQGSTNGTYYLGGRVTEVIVHPGSVLRLGRTTVALLPNAAGDGIEIDPHPHYGRMLGATEVMRRIFGIMRLLETSEAPVLITGEPGTGRRLAAETLHERSPRRNGPLVVLDCEQTHQDLIDALLFGHAAGVLTNATSQRIGLIEQAHGGTLLIANVDALPLGVQSRLVRALETRRVRRLGDDVARPFDVRLVCTARGDLNALIDAGDFREELAYFLSVVTFALPRLRDRAGDIPILAQHLAQSVGGEEDPLPQEILDRLSEHDWPGNVAELRDVVCRLRDADDVEEALAAQSPRPARRTALTPIDPSVPFEEARAAALEEFERAYLRAVLERCEGEVSVAARQAGMSGRAFRELMERHGL